MSSARITIDLPPWHAAWEKSVTGPLQSAEERMRFVIATALKNVTEGSGGPFAAAVFEHASGRLVAVGVNRVLASSSSVAHAEIVTLALAQQRVGSFDLGGSGFPEHQLVISADPCAMCFGSIPWSGVRSVITSCNGEAVERITGFDEGPVHPNWKAELERRGICVQTGLLAHEGIKVLEEYNRLGSPVYNGRGTHNASKLRLP